MSVAASNRAAAASRSAASGRGRAFRAVVLHLDWEGDVDVPALQACSRATRGHRA